MRLKSSPIILVIALLLLGCDPLPSNLRVLAFGDSGSCDQPDEPWACKQNEIAQSMKRVCDNAGCDMGIMLGDNIYEEGVESATDDRFRYKYEYHYSPLNRPIYSSIGNHDIWGLTTTQEAQIQAQIDYTQHSKTWKMPDEYYDYIHADVHFFVIHTNHFDDEQKQWLEHGLRTSQANWKVVYGHHPIYSNGYHGNNYSNIENLLPIVCEQADLYVSGHDHDLQLLDADCGLPLVISGASGKTRNSNTDENAPRRRWSVGNTYGFARLVFEKSHFKVHYYNEHGLELYSRTYTRLFRIQQRDATKSIADNNSLIAIKPQSIRSANTVELKKLTTVKGNNLQARAMWRIERTEHYIRIINKRSGEYLHAKLNDVVSSPPSTQTTKGLAVKNLSVAHWKLVTPDANTLYIKNLGTDRYLTAGDNNKLSLTTEADSEKSNWILSPVDFSQYN